MERYTGYKRIDNSLAVEDGGLEQRSTEIVTRLAEGAPTATSWTKYALNNWLRSARPIFDASLALEMLRFAGPEADESFAYYREKRGPVFTRGSGV